MSEILVRVSRGGYTESLHRGCIAVVDSRGKRVGQVGDPDRVTFWRSAAKPFQVMPLIERGGAEKFGLAGEEIALMASSHNGEPEHLRVLAGILGKLGLGEDDLECGVAAPLHRRTAREMTERGEKHLQGHNPCSGKHAAMLALARLLDLPARGYTSLEHPVQQRMLEVVAAFTEMTRENILVGIDGCGVPVFGMPLRNMALAYAAMSGRCDRINDSSRQALARVVRAMTAHPYYVAGSGRPDTAIMEVSRGMVVAKVGVEGIYCMYVDGLGIAIKVDDGGNRALGPVAVEVLLQLGALDESQAEQLAGYRHPQIKNHRGEAVGMIEPVFRLS